MELAFRSATSRVGTAQFLLWEIPSRENSGLWKKAGYESEVTLTSRTESHRYVRKDPYSYRLLVPWSVDMPKKTIPKEVVDKVERIVDDFNKQFLNANQYYVTRYMGQFLYLDRSDHGRVGPICRLKYTGRIDTWEFAVFKWSSEKYSSSEFFFPGMSCVDGTVEGAMKAGLEAYP